MILDDKDKPAHNIYRRENPKARRPGWIANKGGSSRRKWVCICGASHTDCARYPPTRHMLSWAIGHEKTCVAIKEYRERASIIDAPAIALAA